MLKKKKTRTIEKSFFDSTVGIAQRSITSRKREKKRNKSRKNEKEITVSATLFEAESRTIPRGTIPSKGRLRIHVRGIIPFSICAPVKKRGKKKRKREHLTGHGYAYACPLRIFSRNLLFH